EVAVHQSPGALPDPVGHGLVVDLLAQGDQVGDLVSGHERQGRLACGVDVVAAFRAADPEDHLPPAEAEGVAGGEQVARGQAAGEVVDRRAAHERVVHVEEGGGAGGVGALVGGMRVQRAGGEAGGCRGGGRSGGCGTAVATVSETAPHGTEPTARDAVWVTRREHEARGSEVSHIYLSKMTDMPE